MRFFKLPDLGEGLPEAEIVEWHVKTGDQVAVDQLLVSVETAKAIVEVPSPQAGIIASCFGGEGDLVHTGEPLVEFADAEDDDTGTVVGDLSQSSNHTSQSDHFIIGAAGREPNVSHSSARATPAVKALARRLEIDLATIQGSGRNGMITAHDVEQAKRLQHEHGDAVPLKGVRRVMANNMQLSHSQVVPVSLCDDVDVNSWADDEDITMRLVHAIGVACKAEPALNAWFDGATMSRRLQQRIDIGIAVDTPDGLFVPVLRDISERPLTDLRQGLNQLRRDVKDRTIPPAELQGASISLTNFGTLAGRYATPIVVPPTVAIIGAGGRREAVLPVDGQPAVRMVIPLSLTFDHRCITGGEAARFLAALMADLRITKL